MIVMKKIPIGTKRRTGERCPESGVWKKVTLTLLDDEREIPLSNGETFPPDQNKSVVWELIRYA